MKYLILVFGILMSGCSSVEVKNYEKETPKLVLEDYFNKTVDAYGIFTGRSGEVKKRFHVVIESKMENGELILDESFTNSDGTKDKRIWRIKKVSESKYEGRAGDVDGFAVGEIAGNALRWKYTLKLKVDDSVYHVKFDDWMYLMDNKIMLNKSKMSKWGIYLGEVTLTFVKR